ncbi:hypothetical protein LR48_Vigan03g279700 [Vigna angularis]|uniref:J domain-containing protein n=3 Tax=Phaseolus angularis TaxID=3914 RepID=A0A0L9U977_PHAAN|nr:uncharacterized protein LOC108329558 isoform X1 [Vigna angularis]KAG2406536.1 uncharacterized protein HKW66_Vig0057920 [Vigna angularis]KOM39415.1 hypothetical protein LR48_Vigan03g279700 [Vigna angularis]BAT86262.1 hypothetical protein VIGAN_04389800 [Vigna angularis var. angularis]
MAITTHTLSSTEKRHWWLTNRKIVEKYIKDARSLIATQDQREIVSALNLLDAALAISPRLDQALELRARALLCLRRFKEIADMLQDYIPSLRINDDSSSSSSSVSSDTSREGVKLLSSCESPVRDQIFKCFSVSDLKKKVMAGLCKNGEKEGQWRYLVLGEACCHLGLMEDAMVLLQTGKRLASATLRRESVCWSQDSFNVANIQFSSDATNAPPTTPPRTLLAADTESVTQLLGHIKFLLRRRAAALAALDAGLYSEAIRHFSKIVDGRRSAPQSFLVECYLLRASAHRSAGRIAESIADCNRTLALDPTCIQALETRASLFENIRCLPDSLHDLEHLKLLYNSILRDRKLPGPAWKRHNVRYREIPGKLCTLTIKIQELKQKLASRETGNVDYYALIGVRRGCSRSELERAHLLLSLRHKPDKATGFIERCELADERDVESVNERAKMSSLLLYRLVQKGYTTVMSNIMDEEAAEKQRKKAALLAIQVQKEKDDEPELWSKVECTRSSSVENNNNNKNDDNNNNNAQMSQNSSMVCSSTVNPAMFQGVFCRDIAVVGNLLSQVGFNRSMPVKYEALSC